jgi:lipoprotein-releasing system permease protein
MSYALSIARRLIFSKSAGRRLSGPVITVATAAVALGVAVMIVSLSVGMGFKSEIRNKIVGFGTHIQVMSFDYNQSYETNPILDDSTLYANLSDTEGVRHVQPFIMKPGIIKTDDAIQGIALKGIDTRFDWSFLSSIMQEGDTLAISDTTQCNGIVLSRTLTNSLKLKLGDPVRMYFIQNNGIRARRFNLTGIFDSHFPEFDEKMAYVDMQHLSKLNNWQKDQISGYEILTNDFDKIDDTSLRLLHVTSTFTTPDNSFLRVVSIKDMQPQIFGWLGLLDTNIAVIIILIIAVAGLNMISGLLILILEDTNMIGILKSMGMRNRKIRQVFIYITLYIVGRGMLIGNILGLGLCLLQAHTHMISLDPSSYYLDTVPIEIIPTYIILLNIGTLILTTLMLIGPSFVISRILPAKSIRFN